MLIANAHDRFQFFSDLAGEVGLEVTDWIAPLVVLIVMIVVAQFVRVLLRSEWLNHPGSRRFYLHQLARPIASLLYVVGAKVFVELAPVSDRLSGWLDNVIFIIFVILVMNLARRAMTIVLEVGSGIESLGPMALKQGFVPLMRNLTTIVVLLTGVVVVLKHFDYNVFSILTALGVGSLAVGLAAQPTLSNMISGFTLIIDRNLGPGDRISVGGMTGDVDVIGLRSTRIRTLDGNILIVPNADMVNSKILNLGFPPRDAACSAQLRIPLTTPFDRVRETLLKIVSSLSHGRPAGRPPSVLLTGFDKGAQLVTVSFWVDGPSSIADSVSEFNEKAVRSLREQGVELHS